MTHSVIVERRPHGPHACYGQCHDAVQYAVGRTPAEPEALQEAWRDVMGLLGDHGPERTRTRPKPTEALWRMRDAYDPYRLTPKEPTE